MPRARRPAAVPATVSASNGEDSHIPADARALIQAHGSSATTVKVWRWSESKYQYEYLKQIPAAEFSEDRLAMRWGGGKFRGDIMDGSQKYVAAIPPFAIAGEPTNGAQASGGASPAPMPDYVARLEATLERAVSAMRPAPAPQADPMATVAAVVAMIVPLLNAVKGTNGGGDVTSTLTLLNAAEERGEKRGRELGELMAGAPAGDSMASVAKEYLPVLAEAMRAKNEAAPPADAPRAVPQLPAPVPASVPMFVPEGFQWLTQLRPFLPQLAQQAAANRDPEVIADFAVSQLSDAIAEQIEAVAPHPEFTATVMRAFPELAARHGEWLAAFVERVRVSVLPDEHDQDDARQSSADVAAEG